MVGDQYDFKTELWSARVPLMADSAQIGQILLNLATNARDAMPDGGTILVQVECLRVDSPPVSAGAGPGMYAHLSLSDTGSGMDEKTRARVFEPFFTSKDVGKGTGLGLSIVWGIVEQHRGFITVDSEPGRGTTVHVYLPIAGGTDPGAGP